ncbi:MAG: hypothetical protein HY744_27175 [Deltaproteobacteria bacterium]|nr:hypothetical protein [Deltaproteobacteria bacterium]
MLGAAACGHPASRAECEEIFERSARIELTAQGVADPELVRQRIAEAHRAKGEPLVLQCVGRRVTHGAMSCLRRAQTAAALDECLR